MKITVHLELVNYNKCYFNSFNAQKKNKLRGVKFLKNPINDNKYKRIFNFIRIFNNKKK